MDDLGGKTTPIFGNTKIPKMAIFEAGVTFSKAGPSMLVFGDNLNTSSWRAFHQDNPWSMKNGNPKKNAQNVFPIVKMGILPLRPLGFLPLLFLGGVWANWNSKLISNKLIPSNTSLSNSINKYIYISLSQWLNFKLFGITYSVGKIKFKPLFFRVHWLSEIYIYIYLFFFSNPFSVEKLWSPIFCAFVRGVGTRT